MDVLKPIAKALFHDHLRQPLANHVIFEQILRTLLSVAGGDADYLFKELLL
jgi:hypothetical protein